jgi:hypothetical protein
MLAKLRLCALPVCSQVAVRLEVLQIALFSEERAGKATSYCLPSLARKSSATEYNRSNSDLGTLPASALSSLCFVFCADRMEQSLRIRWRGFVDAHSLRCLELRIQP